MRETSEIIFAWLRVLDELTYYELFGIASEANPDEIRQAFHEFCDTFHPDRHLVRRPEERRAVSTIFKRGTEAYLVLSNVGLRGHYDSQLTTRPPGGPQRLSFSTVSRAASAAFHRPSGPFPLEAAARSAAAQPFARRADELMAQGALQQAKLQLLMANHRDPGNDTLETALREVEAKLAEQRPRRGAD